jgi:hypothetical protein
MLPARLPQHWCPTCSQPCAALCLTSSPPRSGTSAAPSSLSHSHPAYCGSSSSQARCLFLCLSDPFRNQCAAAAIKLLQAYVGMTDWLHVALFAGFLPASLLICAVPLARCPRIFKHASLHFQACFVHRHSVIVAARQRRVSMSAKCVCSIPELHFAPKLNASAGSRTRRHKVRLNGTALRQARTIIQCSTLFPCSHFPRAVAEGFSLFLW